MITERTRRESNEKIKPTKLTKYIKILNVLGSQQLTAREIMKRTGARDMNEVRPRITELVKDYHEIIVCGEKYDEATNRTVALFRRATEQEKLELDNMNHIPVID